MTAPIVPSSPTRIILVEDEIAVRRAFVRGLMAAGFDVVDVGSAEAALTLIREPAQQFDLLITDVVLPGMNGRELSERAVAIQPAMRVLFVSGYAEDEVLRRGLLYGLIDILAKPFSLDELTAKVREITARPAA